MSDTPETDSYAERDWWTLFRANEHARKLERERDEARDDLIKSYTKIKDLESEIRGVGLLRDKSKRERDEAREKLDEEMKWHHRTHTELVHTQCKILDMQMGRDEAHKIANRAIDDLAWFNETNAQRLRAELDQLKEGAK
jgi:chromosome segregation ATPase